MTSRRAFLLGLGAALAAPAVVRADSLMKLWVPPAPKLITSFDDYEEGTWTPKIMADGMIYSKGVGRYVKVGRAVYFTITTDIPWSPNPISVRNVPHSSPVVVMGSGTPAGQAIIGIGGDLPKRIFT